MNIVEIRKPEIDAKLVADSIASSSNAVWPSTQHETRRSKRPCAWVPTGHPDQLRRPSGRRGNRATEWYREGRVPLHTLRADVDYGTGDRPTTYGTWRGEGLGVQR